MPFPIYQIVQHKNKCSIGLAESDLSSQKMDKTTKIILLNHIILLNLIDN